MFETTPCLPDPCGPVLHCPSCEGNWLHHGRVEVFARRREDADDGLHVSVRRMQVETTTDMDGNPSGRRDGLLVYFSCEWCCAVPVLRLVQHQGQTFMGWEDRHGETSCGPHCDRYPDTDTGTLCSPLHAETEGES